VNRTDRHQNANGWILLEVLMAMAALALLIGCMVSISNDMRKATRAMAARREATRKADKLLWQRPAVDLQLQNVRIESLKTGVITTGYTWKQVTVTVDGQTKTVVGLTSDQTEPKNNQIEMEQRDDPMARR